MAKAPAAVIRRWALAIAIAIVFNLFVNYGIATFYKEPKYEQYCPTQGGERYPMKAYPMTVQSADVCRPAEAPKNLSDSCSTAKGYVQWDYNASGCPYQAYCETCHVPFEDSLNQYNSNTFMILVVVGILALIGGLMIGVESVGGGFLLGGIISIIIGTMRNWSNLTDIIRFLVLGLLLAMLIYIGYKKVRE